MTGGDASAAAPWRFKVSNAFFLAGRVVASTMVVFFHHIIRTKSMIKAPLALSVAICFVTAAALLAQTSVTTDPVGFTTTTLLGSPNTNLDTDTFVSIPFTRQPEFIGGIASTSTSGTITVVGTPWMASQFKYIQGAQPKHYYVLIGPGAGTKEGRTYTITDNTNNSLTVTQTALDDASGIPANTQVEIIPYWTPATIFPASDAGISFMPTTNPPTYKTLLRVPDYTAATYNSPPAAEYYFNNGSWQRVSPAGVGDDDPLLPDGYFVVRNAAGVSTGSLTNIGSVLLKKLAVPLIAAAGPRDNPVSMVRPVNIALDATGLGPADTSFGTGDRLLLFNNAVGGIDKPASSTYYYDTAAAIPGWRLMGDTTPADRGGDIIPAGTGFVIRKAAAALSPAFWTNAFPISAVSAVSRKTHGNGAGNMDIPLPLSGAPGIECRSGGITQIVFTFPAGVTINTTLGTNGASVTSGAGDVSGVSGGNNTNTVTVNLNNTGNAPQWITVTLYGVSNGTNRNDVAVRAGVLLGDVNANRLVNSTDSSLVQAQSGKPVTLSNFRIDVNASGLINSTDTSTVQSKSGTGLP
jgi:uncharacterized protein (TIGR02597 family)